MKIKAVSRTLATLFISSAVLLATGCGDSPDQIRTESAARMSIYQKKLGKRPTPDEMRTPAKVVPPMPGSSTGGEIAYADQNITGYQIAKRTSPDLLSEEELEVTRTEVAEDWPRGVAKQPAQFTDFDLRNTKVAEMTLGEVRQRFGKLNRVLDRTRTLASHKQEREGFHILSSRAERLGSRIPERKQDSQLASPDLVRKVLEVELEVEQFYQDLSV